ncbi:PAS domain-containing sensor histidine kinase [Heliophilum fasciatum]|nr:PAS domain-containing sensor histidine kinase [Heliophilum fasciatum]MCW2277194.1 PAS domain S-box-containing protein [Heliophilum fasciatum]
MGSEAESFFALSPYACLLLRFDCRIMRVNVAYEELLGYAVAEVVDHNFYEFIHPDDHRTVNKLEQRLSQRSCVQYMDVRARAKSGHYIWLRFKCISKVEEKKIFAYVISQGIPVGIENEQQHDSWEERFAILSNATSSLIALCSLHDNRFLEVNNRFLQVTGYERSEVIGKNGEEIGLLRDGEKLADCYEAIQTKGTFHNLEMDFYTKKSEKRIGLFAGEIVYHQDQFCLLMVCTDITEQQLMKQEMLRLDRLHLVGQMAAGIGHEIRNPMTTVRGYLQMLSVRPEYGMHQRIFTTMIGELDRANQILCEFLSMARQPDGAHIDTDLREVIDSLVPLMQATALMQNKQIVTKLHDVAAIQGDPKEVRQLLLNLVQNGLDAMEAGGVLTITLKQEHNQTLLSVADQGPGIPAHILERIGTPFLTTKENGVGIGLTICYGIAARHQATIDVSSSPRGTTFHVAFPVHANESTTDHQEAAYPFFPPFSEKSTDFSEHFSYASHKLTEVLK